MHYMYLPICIESNGMWDVRLPANLMFANDLVQHAIYSETIRGNSWKYVYLIACRGYATPGNPLNRPGWHSDGFGTPDVNYVWTDRFPTQFAIKDFENISSDHNVSIQQFAEQVNPSLVFEYPDCMLMRLDSSVIHAAPEIPAPDGVRSFLKVSFSNDRYNLVGNSHYHLFEYDWQMFERDAVRNDLAHAGRDSVTLRWRTYLRRTLPSTGRSGTRITPSIT